LSREGLSNMAITLSHKIALTNVSNQQEFDINHLLDQHHDRLYWMIRKIVLVHNDAQDVLQNTWIRIHKGLPSFKGNSKIDTWIYRIAYNECMRFLTQKKANLRLDEIDTNYIQTLTTDEYFNANETVTHFQAALATLPQNQRHVFSLKYFDELTFKDMAVILDRNENSIKTLYYKAEKKIKEYLTKQTIV
jgi:RNA polymerase sigma factor (sigma-70 family)